MWSGQNQKGRVHSFDVTPECKGGSKITFDKKDACSYDAHAIGNDIGDDVESVRVTGHCTKTIFVDDDIAGNDKCNNDSPQNKVIDGTGSATLISDLRNDICRVVVVVTTCNAGFHNTDGPNCGQNVCECKDGTAVKGTACTEHKASKCGSCNAGFHLEGEMCKPNVCECKNGIAMKGTACTEHEAQKCGSCNAGFHLEGETCKPNVCECKNGIAMKGTACTEHEAQKCGSCNA